MADNRDSSELPGGFDPSQFMQFMQRTWQQAMPGTVGLPPGMTIEDLDKRIQELRIVEQWLEVNLNMLRASVQALEVQRGTLAALQAFGDQFDTTSGAKGTNAEKSEGASDASEAFTNAFQQMTDLSQANLLPWWQGLQRQFENIASTAVMPGNAPTEQASAPRKPKRAASAPKKRTTKPTSE